ncbi:MAG: alkene reductase [Polyangiaceae bacterium]|nr:alkene reductase [Polyangiaceae bacterium]
MTEKLLSDFFLGPLNLKNRVVMAPMTRARATADHIPTPIMAEYYGSRASCGLLISEGIAPAPAGAGYARMPGIWNQEQLDGWKSVTQAVHEKGGKIAAQIMHSGRVGHTKNMPQGAEVLGPSATTAPGEMYTDEAGPQPYPEAREMTHGEVEEAISAYVSAAENAVAAGFDAIELHGANGYLIEQFLAPVTNHRQDQWGGDFKKRARFVLQIATACAAAIGPEKVGIRLSPLGVFNGIEPWESLADDYIWLAEELGKLNLVYLHLVDHSSMGAPSVPSDLKQAMRASFQGAFILSGGYDAEHAEKALQEDQGELVAFGRPLIANPDLVERIAQGAAWNEPDFDTFYTPGPKGYNDYPLLSTGA